MCWKRKKLLYHARDGWEALSILKEGGGGEHISLMLRIASRIGRCLQTSPTVLCATAWRLICIAEKDGHRRRCFISFMSVKV